MHLRRTFAAVLALGVVLTLVVPGLAQTPPRPTFVTLHNQEAAASATGAVAQTSGHGSLTIQWTSTGSWNGTLNFESSVDNTTFTPVACRLLNSATTFDTVATTSEGAWVCPVVGTLGFRARITGRTQGAVTVKIGMVGISAGGTGGGVPSVECPDIGGNHLNFQTGLWVCGASSSGGAPGNAAADGVTKGIATFAPPDFNATGGVITLDYANAQAASGATKGFLTAADFTTFTAKAPPDAQYWTGAASGGLSAAHNLGALTTGLVLNTAGTPSAYGGSVPCTTQFMRSLTATGAATCAAVNLGTDVTGNLLVTNLNNGLGASAATCWKGDGTWGACGGAGAWDPAAPETLSNKRITKRGFDQPDVTPITINTDLYDFIRIDELSQDTTFTLPSGTPQDGDLFTLAVLTSVQRLLTFTTGVGGFGSGHGYELPTRSTPGVYVLYGFRWSTPASRWHLAAATQTTTRGTLGQCFRSNGPDSEPSFQSCPVGGGGGDALTSQPLSQFAATTSLQLAGVVTDETGTGAFVLATNPVLVTPNLGTPSAVILSNATGLPIGTGVAGLAAGVATWLAAPSSANLAAALIDEVGTTGGFVRSDGNIATATALAANGSNCAPGLLSAGVDALGVAEGCITLSATNAQTGTYSVVAADFDNYKTIPVSINSFTITLPATAPTDGKYLKIINYGSGVVTISRNGLLINGQAVNISLREANASSPSMAYILSNGSNYIAAVMQSNVGPEKLENKRIKPRGWIQGNPSATSITIDTNLYDFVRVDELNNPVTFAVPGGAPDDGDIFLLSIFTTVARGITWITTSNGFSSEYGITLPASTTAGVTVLLGFRWSSVSSRWGLIAATPPGTGGGGGGTGFVHLPVSAVRFPATNPATLDGSEKTLRLFFDAATSQCAYWVFRMPPDYVSAPVLKWPYSMLSATSGGVSIDVSVMATTPGDAADIQTDSYGSVNNCDDTTVPGTAGFPDQISCTLTNNDGLAAGDIVRLQVCRATADASDTAGGFMEAITPMLEYAK